MLSEAEHPSSPHPKPFAGAQGDNEEAQPIALYVHIPFCETKCPYCDFNTYARIEPLIPAYVAALRGEIGTWGINLGNPAVGTVFFGGGTPSYLRSGHIEALMGSVRQAFDLDDGAEVTLEANPGDFTVPKLEAYLQCGVNRLSIGVQSFDDRLLSVLGRRHSADEAMSAFGMARDAGFDNISIDLMYGLPYQSLDDWAQTLSDAGDLESDHISMYCLTLELDTPMERWVRVGRMPEPDPDLAADMYLMAQEAMEPMGYRHYEISNWAVPGRESRHNLTYWRNEPYLGVGPGAHSYLAGHRFYNMKSPKEYIRRLEDGRSSPQQATPSLTLPFDGGGDQFLPARRWNSLKGVPVVEKVEAIDRRLEMAETMMLGLRLETGIGVADFARRFGETPDDAYSDTLTELGGDGLLETAEGRLRLTDRGRLLGNEVFSRFFDYVQAPA